jgi:hypothetical protein
VPPSTEAGVRGDASLHAAPHGPVGGPTRAVQHGPSRGTPSTKGCPLDAAGHTGPMSGSVGHQLSVRYGAKEFCLSPDGPEFTFGRSRSCTLSLADGDDDVSRRAGTIRWEGPWLLCNDSTTRIIDVVVRGVTFPLSSFSIWAISPSPPDLEIRVYGSYGPYTLLVTNHGPQPPTEDGGPTGSGPKGGPEDPTATFPDPSVHERRVLAAKFLSQRVPGDSVGDTAAAKIATVANPAGEEVTRKAVEMVVKRWRTLLQCRLHVMDVEGRSNVDTLGRKLLALGVIRQEDRVLLEPRG